jgi:Mg-chelatase subunit ChlI
MMSNSCLFVVVASLPHTTPIQNLLSRSYIMSQRKRKSLGKAIASSDRGSGAKEVAPSKPIKTDDARFQATFSDDDDDDDVQHHASQPNDEQQHESTDQDHSDEQHDQDDDDEDEQQDDDDEQQDDDEDEQQDDDDDDDRVVTEEEAAAFRAEQERRGVIYMSRIPPYMQPTKLRHILSQYGEVHRIYLTPERMQPQACRWFDTSSCCVVGSMH